MMLVSCLGFNGPLRQYFSLYYVSCLKHMYVLLFVQQIILFSASGNMTFIGFKYVQIKHELNSYKAYELY